ncbi:5-(carboxyamino)imidazole ribonucleotide synthase [Hydrogenibacillus schlegelii]|nr:5-(carboxyamino)imidazole ribonucleotide synthase [Hydrogenibacillus schlegelii]
MRSKDVRPEAPLLPGRTIGILGGGQLGRMIALAGRAMGYRFAVLDPAEEAPARPVADVFVRGDFSDRAALLRLGAASDVVVYEFEHLDAEAVAALAESVPVPQGTALLRLAQHRALEKAALSAGGFPVAPYAAIARPEDWPAALRTVGLPALLKTTTGGYDGKGQWRLRTAAEAAAAEAIVRAAFRETGAGRSGEARAEGDAAGARFILERELAFRAELSVIVARRADGAMANFPPAENVHVRGILHRSIVPARVPKTVEERAVELARAIATHLDAVGLLAVEFFWLKDGALVVNELAPRPHNTGHYTLDAASTSQFEQFVRAVSGLPLGAVRLWSPVVMVNVLGEHLPALLKALPTLDPRFKVHLYGKAEARPGRKMGHVNILADSVEEALRLAEATGVWPELQAERENP